MLGRLLKAREFQAPVERAIFSMVANRALEPMSKLAIEDWAGEWEVQDEGAEVVRLRLHRR